jgi:hypothetical protein
MVMVFTAVGFRKAKRTCRGSLRRLGANWCAAICVSDIVPRSLRVGTLPMQRNVALGNTLFFFFRLRAKSKLSVQDIQNKCEKVISSSDYKLHRMVK